MQNVKGQEGDERYAIKNANTSNSKKMISTGSRMITVSNKPDVRGDVSRGTMYRAGRSWDVTDMLFSHDGAVLKSGVLVRWLTPPHPLFSADIGRVGRLNTSRPEQCTPAQKNICHAPFHFSGCAQRWIAIRMSSTWSSSLVPASLNIRSTHSQHNDVSTKHQPRTSSHV